MDTPLLILGAGDFAMEVLDIAECAGGFQPLGFVNSLERPAPGTRHAGLPVYWAEDLPVAADQCALAGGIVSTRRRAFLEAVQSRGYRFARVLHPSATISRHAELGAGAVVNAGVIISRGAVIAPQVVVNRGALIGHDVRIGSFATIGPGVNIAGGVSVGCGAYVGVGAVIRDHVSIGAESVVGAGAVVVKDVPPNVLVTGLPAKVSKEGIHGW